MIVRASVLAAMLWSAAGLAAESPAQIPAAQVPAAQRAPAGEVDDAVRALQQAIAASPEDPALHVRLSQVYASAGQGRAALAAIERALALRPGEPEYLRARATLSTWVGEYRMAQDSYHRLQAVYPGDFDIVLALARVSAWAGDTDRAVKEYRRYLSRNASNAAVWLELARSESWRGNFAGALEALEAHRVRAGESQPYLAELASVFAAGDRPHKATDLVTPLLTESPRSYELNVTQTLALARQRRARAAFDSLETVRQLSPDDPQTRTVEHVLRTLLGSSAQAGITSYSDSDELSVRRMAPRAMLALSSGTQLSAGYERTRLAARAGSGLDRVGGGTGANHEHTWAGAAQRLGAFTVNGQLGYATGEGHVHTTYGVGLEARPADSLRFTVSHAHGGFVVSPRTVGLGLISTGERAQIDWTPTLRDQLIVDVAFQRLSDGNRRWQATVSPRRTVARRARFNLDLGASAYRLETTRDLDHGYYDPRWYEYYAATMYPYLKLRENVGLAIDASLGVQRDHTWPSFRFGGNVSGEATFGIYRPWVLKVNGGATLNGRLESGAFRGFIAGAALVRRF